MTNGIEEEGVFNRIYVYDRKRAGIGDGGVIGRVVGGPECWTLGELISEIQS